MQKDPISKPPRNFPGTAIAWGEMLRLLGWLVVLPWGVAALLVGVGFLSTPQSPAAWLFYAFAWPAGWAAFLSYGVDARTLLGRSKAEGDRQRLWQVIFQQPHVEIIEGDKVEGDKIQGDRVAGNKYQAEQMIIHQHADAAQADPPVNLPAAGEVFVGREKEMAQLMARLDQDKGGVALIAGVRGMGGVGKTELALQVAHRLAHRYPARLFIDATERDADALLAEIIRLFQPERKPPDDAAARASLARQLMGQGPGLLILDNATWPKHVQPVLRAIPGGWAVLVTSRRRFGLSGGLLLDLNVLEPDAAVALLRELDVAGEEGDLARLAEACGRLPLALRVAAAFLRNHPDWTLAEYLEALEKAPRLDHLRDEGEGDVAAVLGLSLEWLEKEQPELARRWRMLAVMPAPFDRELAAGVWETDPASARDDLSELVRWSLVEYPEDARLYRLHDLLRELAGEPDAEVVRRHAFWVLQQADEADERFKRGDLSGLARFDLLWPHLEAAWARLRAADDEDARRWLRDFVWDFPSLLDLRTTPAQRIPYLQRGVAAARALGDRRAEGALLGNLGLAYAHLGRVEEAIGYYERALDIAREIGDRRGEGNHLGNLGLAYADLGRVEEAIGYYQQALDIAREIGDRRGEGNDLGNLGLAYAALGRVEEAIGYYEQALDIAREIGDRRAEGALLGNLGLAYADLGRVEEAIKYYQQALAIAREIGDRRGEGLRAWNLGLALEKQGRYAEAAGLMRILVEYEQEIGHPVRRQHPLGTFIVDFYCAKARLIIEVDGPIHNKQVDYDQEREAWLESHKGHRVIRFTNEEVMHDLEGVLAKIRKALEQTS